MKHVVKTVFFVFLAAFSTYFWVISLINALKSIEFGAFFLLILQFFGVFGCILGIFLSLLALVVALLSAAPDYFTELDRKARYQRERVKTRRDLSKMRDEDFDFSYLRDQTSKD